MTTHNELGPKIHWVEMPLNPEEKEVRKAWLEGGEEGMRRCDEVECNNQPKVSTGNNEAGEVHSAITKREDQGSKTVDPRKDELDGRAMEDDISRFCRKKYKVLVAR